ncbi:hypothetical protein BKA82DRAFT_4190799 [Pisolithus tinctorius]|nr:hypothetical protein BKA82DRAFT_4190799 [Pisolithus tinctorius]
MSTTMSKVKSRYQSTPKDSSPSSSSFIHDNSPRPAKRPRLTPSSSSTSAKDSTPPTDIDSARKASALRVLNVWSQLAERYNKRMDEDDIIDLYSGAIIKDRGVLRSANVAYDIGRFAGDDEQEISEDEPEEDEDADELDMLPRREASSDNFETLLSDMLPLSATTDADDLSDFLEAERQRRRLVGGDGDDDEDDVEEEEVSPLPVTRSPERTPAGKWRSSKVRIEGRNEEQDDSGEEESSEDELAVWGSIESSPVRPRSTPKSSARDAAVDLEVIEITDSDSDKEFSLLLKGPPRKRTLVGCTRLIKDSNS